MLKDVKFGALQGVDKFGNEYFENAKDYHWGQHRWVEHKNWDSNLLAEALVREGVPFRDAHETVGRLVAHCEEQGRDLRQLTLAELQGFHDAFPASGAELLDLERSVEARSLPGGTARATVGEALERARQQIAEEAQRLEEDRT